MSDDESMTDTSQPPSLEDANLDDVSSDASAVSDGSASFSINTDDEESDDDSDADVELHPNGGGSDDDDLGATFVVPLKTGSDHDVGESPRTAARMQRRRSVEDRDMALEKNSLRRQASNNTLLAMRAATQAVSPEESEDTANDNLPRRRPPPRTKSGGVFAGAVVAEVEGVEGEQDLNETGEQRRRPPPRTKSGEGMPGAALPPRRRPPPRSKSGKAGEGLLTRDPLVSDTRGNERASFHMSLNVEGGYALGSDADGMLMSPPGRRSRRDREQVLSLNAVKRQASNDQLRAMQDAARQVHAPGISRAKSSAAVVQRRPPPRSMSGECFAPNIVVEGEENAVPERRRRPPPRTKSGEGLQDGEGNATRRRPPPRTKSGGVFAAPPSIPTIEE